MFEIPLKGDKINAMQLSSSDSCDRSILQQSNVHERSGPQLVGGTIVSRLTPFERISFVPCGLLLHGKRVYNTISTYMDLR